MSLHRFDAKRDAAEPAIVLALEAVGAYVHAVSQEGLPDLLVAFRGDTYLLEVKSEKRGLTPAQEKFHERWPADNLFIVRSAEEALKAIGAIS